MVGSYVAPTGTPPKLVQHGFVLRKGQFTSFDVPDSTFTGGFAINTEGDVTGHYGRPVPAGKMRGFLLRNGVFTTFGAEDWGLRNTMSCGFGINAEQYIVGHFVDGSGQHGFLLTGSVLTPIDHPEAGASYYAGPRHQSPGRDCRQLQGHTPERCGGSSAARGATSLRWTFPARSRPLPDGSTPEGRLQALFETAGTCCAALFSAAEGCDRRRRWFRPRLHRAGCALKENVVVTRQ